MSQPLVALLVGAGFGAVLVAARLNEYDTIHKMLLLQELDVFLLMASAIATAAPVLWWLRQARWRTRLNGELAVDTGADRTMLAPGDAHRLGLDLTTAAPQHGILRTG